MHGLRGGAAGRGLSRGRIGGAGGVRGERSAGAAAVIGEAIGPGRRDRPNADGLGVSGEARGLAGGAPPAEQPGQPAGLALERGFGGDQEAQVAERIGGRGRSRRGGVVHQRRELAHEPALGCGPGQGSADEGDEVTTRTDHQQGIRGDIHD